MGRGLPVQASPSSDEMIIHQCRGSGRNLSLPLRAFAIPAQLQPILAPLMLERRHQLARNPQNLTAEELTASFCLRSVPALVEEEVEY